MKNSNRILPKKLIFFPKTKKLVYIAGAVNGMMHGKSMIWILTWLWDEVRYSRRHPNSMVIMCNDGSRVFAAVTFLIQQPSQNSYHWFDANHPINSPGYRYEPIFWFLWKFNSSCMVVSSRAGALGMNRDIIEKLRLKFRSYKTNISNLTKN